MKNKILSLQKKIKKKLLNNNLSKMIKMNSSRNFIRSINIIHKKINYHSIKIHLQNKNHQKKYINKFSKDLT